MSHLFIVYFLEYKFYFLLTKIFEYLTCVSYIHTSDVRKVTVACANPLV